MFLKNRGSITYQASLALLYPYARLLFNTASGNNVLCPCGVLASTHAFIDFISSGISLPSKSSIYEIPCFSIARECPGIRCANSPVKVMLDGTFVSRKGILSITVVRNCDSV
ncbi:hypothetical protein ES708_17842 [subsurface metagenome]